MKIKKSHLLVCGLAVVIFALTSGCGGGGTSSSSSTSTSVAPKQKGAAASFLRPKSPNNKYVSFGEEASTAELQAATKVLKRNLAARQAAQFSVQCATLAMAQVEEVAKPKKGTAAVSACPRDLKKIAEPLKVSAEVRADTLGGSIDALRVEGSHGYALFHGTDKVNYAIPMTMENGEWLVGALVNLELGSS